MKIGVIADTHGNVDAWRKVMKKFFHDADMIIHAGDIFNYGPRNIVHEGTEPGDLAEEMNGLEIPIIAARGNCDSDIDATVVSFPIQSPFALVQADSLRILVNHGDLLDDEKKIELAKKWHVNVFVSGHTHRPKLAREGDIVLLNPGSPSLPKEEPTVGLILKEGDQFEVRIIDIETGQVIID